MSYIRTHTDTTLRGILRDLRRNPKSRINGTWERRRLGEVQLEFNRRGISEREEVSR